MSRSWSALFAAVALLVALPVGEATVLLALMLTLDVGAAAWALRPPPLAPKRVVVPIRLATDDSEEVARHLLRRTVPELRMRRPGGVVAAQVHWRKAGETRRSRQAIF